MQLYPDVPHAAEWANRQERMDKFHSERISPRLSSRKATLVSMAIAPAGSASKKSKSVGGCSECCACHAKAADVLHVAPAAK